MSAERNDGSKTPGDAPPAASGGPEGELAREQREHDRQTARAVDDHLHVREHGSARSPDERPAAGPRDRVEGGGAETVPALDFADRELGREREEPVRGQGTYAADGADSGRLGPPTEQLSPTNRPRERDDR